MTKKRAKSVAASASRGRAPWTDPDDAPEITDEMLDRATIVKDGTVLQRGRPPVGERAKKAVPIRLDVDVVEAYRALGRGWMAGRGGRMDAELAGVARRPGARMTRTEWAGWREQMPLGLAAAAWRLG